MERIQKTITITQTPDCILSKQHNVSYFRQQFHMKSTVLIFSVSAAPVLLSSCGSNIQKEDFLGQRPNIVFLISDDLGFGDTSCYGASNISTPNIDRLCSEGTRFVNTYATSATSTPSRYGILTGTYPWRKENTQIRPGNSGLVIDTECFTLADALHQAGYTTGAVGKWHLGMGPEEGTDFNVDIRPDARDIGFDYEYLIPATVDRVPCVFVENGRVVNLDPNDPIEVNYDHKIGDWPTGKENPELLKLKPTHGHDNTIVNGISRIGWMTGGKSALWVDENIADTITMAAKRFIERNREKPFFLYLGTQDVHVPRIPHPRFEGKSGMGTRGDVILQLDWTVGEIMHTLDSLGLRENTLFVFTSDNGPAIDDGYQDEAQMRLNGHRPSGIYRGGKYSLYEGGTRIPFIVRWPGKVPAGTTQKATLSQVDFYRSICSLLGIEIPQGAASDSRDLGMSFMGLSMESAPFIIEQNRQNTLAIIRHGWKYLEPSDKQTYEYRKSVELGNRTTPQLYNIAKDPREREDLSAKYPEKLEELSAALESVKASEGNLQ